VTWEYLIVEMSTLRPQTRVRMLNEYGAQGWEMVAAHPVTEEQAETVYMKRPLVDPSRECDLCKGKPNKQVYPCGCWLPATSHEAERSLDA